MTIVGSCLDVSIGILVSEEFMSNRAGRTLMPQDSLVIQKGLDNVYVCESKICYIDSANSRLYYRGYSVEDLIESSNYVATCYLLVYGAYPTAAELSSFTRRLLGYSRLPKPVYDFLEGLPKESDTMDDLRTAVSMLGLYSYAGKHQTQAEKMEDGLRIVGAMPSIVAGLWRGKQGKSVLEPRDDLEFASNFLYMLRGEIPSTSDAKIMDKFMILHAEHGINASTFSCMVAASTLSDMYSSITSGIATLKGPLHGGANVEALRFIESIADPSKAKDSVDKALDTGQRIMGFGHRIYKNYDPRYRVLKAIGSELSQRPGGSELFETAQAVEQAALERLSSHGIYPNVDFYSGVVLSMLGIDPGLFTPIFAMSRSAGWVAHALEYLEDNRLIRPKAKYTGEIGLKLSL